MDDSVGHALRISVPQNGSNRKTTKELAILISNCASARLGIEDAAELAAGHVGVSSQVVVGTAAHFGLSAVPRLGWDVVARRDRIR